MSFAGDLWSSVNRYSSQAKMNLKTTLVGTGDQILSKSAGQLIIGQLASVTADSTGGSLRAGDIVQWNGSAWSTPEAVISSFRDTLINGIQNTWFASFPSVTKSMFYTSGTGSTYADVINSTNAYVTITSGATSTNSGNLRYGGLAYSFGYPSMFWTRMQLADSTTSSTARAGMNMEAANDVTNNKVKYGFEGCATCNDTNVSVISSDGTTRSKNTQSTDNYALLGNYAMRHDPGLNVKYRKESGAIVTKATNVPSTGTSDRANAWICGIQTTTSSNKVLTLYGFQAVAQHGDTVPTI